jgi:hypothetical protein
MKLVKEYKSVTLRKTLCHVTVRQNHHDFFEALILIQDGPGKDEYFNCYDQASPALALTIAFDRAHKAGY